MTSIYDSITTDTQSDSVIDYSKLDIKKLQTPLKSLQPGRELSAGGGQNTMTAAAKPTTSRRNHFDSYLFNSRNGSNFGAPK